MLSSLRLSGCTECLVFDGAVDKKMFAAYMEEMLLPTLQSGDIVIMDNLSAHKNSFDVNKFTSQGITIKYLPACSPDQNPVEKMWSKVKSKLIPSCDQARLNSRYNALISLTKNAKLGPCRFQLGITCRIR